MNLAIQMRFMNTPMMDSMRATATHVLDSRFWVAEGASIFRNAEMLIVKDCQKEAFIPSTQNKYTMLKHNTYSNILQSSKTSMRVDDLIA